MLLKSIFFHFFFLSLEDELQNIAVMNAKRRKIIIAIMLLISFGNYTRIKGTENIRAVEFLSIFAIGALSALLLREVFTKEKRE